MDPESYPGMPRPRLFVVDRTGRESELALGYADSADMTGSRPPCPVSLVPFPADDDDPKPMTTPTSMEVEDDGLGINVCF